MERDQSNRELKEKLISFLRATDCAIYITRHSNDFWGLSSDLNIRFVLPEGSTIEDNLKFDKLFDIVGYSTSNIL